MAFVAEVGDETMRFDGADMTVENMNLASEADGSAITTGSFTYSANVDFAVGLLGVSSASRFAHCFRFGVSCIPCNDGVVECINVTYTGLTGTQLSSSTIVELEEAP